MNSIPKSKSLLEEKLRSAEEKGIRPLQVDELDKVTGGYKEGDSTLQSHGLEVYCPNCLNSDPGKIGERVLNDDELHTTEYHCNACGTDFVVDKDLRACIEKNYYKQLVPGYKY